MRRASIDTSQDPTHGLVRALRPATRLLEAEKPALVSHVRPCRLSVLLCCCLSLGTLECWGGRQGGCGPELCVRPLRMCGSPLAVCLVSLFVSVCRSCVSSSSVQRPPIPRWCPVRAWLFFTFLPTYLAPSRPDTSRTCPCSHRHLGRHPHQALVPNPALRGGAVHGVRRPQARPHRRRRR